ncbi:MAG: polyphenol oxidase family protein [Akkermansiaceae bacterium]|nr:polyphenol oxidase family protein [Akkermansiaceae bacterium]MCU0777196.1 polyphenol oxidase family protein [Akkermansiaceae bacterium]
MTEALSFLAPLGVVSGVRAGWVERIPGLEITGDRDEAMRRLRPHHEAEIRRFAGAAADFRRAEQVHGSEVAVVPGAPQIMAADGLPVVSGTDGLVTGQAGVVLVIHVADCGAIWLADRKTGAIGLLHSGKKGTEANIFQRALDRMADSFGTRPEDVTAVLSPCIRPPDYEVDLPAAIARQADAAGVGNFIDCGLNTASDLSRFYSYRKELGKTGRMMALIVRDFPP